MASNNIFPQSVDVTGQTIDVSSFSTEWRKRVTDLEKIIVAKFRESGKERYIVALGGASGSSKSTTSKVLENLMRLSEIPAITASQDGYHFPQEHLLSTLDGEGKPLAEHKGRYDSFDVSSMKIDLERFAKGEVVAFPEYSRKIHNPVANTIHVEGSALLIFEGLWLLYDRTPWNELLPLYDMTVFFHADPKTRKNNTILRHVRGNEHAPHEAELFYEKSDTKNAELILNNIAKHDLDFYLS